jgi:hypothetical protein
MHSQAAALIKPRRARAGVALGSSVPPMLLAAMLAGCATDAERAARSFARPSPAQLHQLVSAELAAAPRFDSFDATNDDARLLAASFKPVLAAVHNHGCRPATAQHVDCTLELVLRFPGLDNRESRVTWERRYALAAQGWQLAGNAY